MLKYWTDPTDWTEWIKLFQGVQSELEEIKIVDPITCALGEVIEPDRINEEYPKVEDGIKVLGEVKDKLNRLKNIAKRWYDLRKSMKIIEAARMNDLYPNEKTQIAYSETETQNERENLEACAVLAEAVHDERSWLYQYRQDLEQMGHNSRMTYKR